MTKYEFLERARDKHGYKYQYPNLQDKVLLGDDIDILYEGVTYRQKVSKHINLGRCPEKNTPAKTTSQFIEEAKSVWGDKYDYSLVVYKGALKKVKIIYDGVVFEQTAVQHLKGLSPEKNLNKDNFIRKAKIKHGDKYDYSQVKFKNGNTAVMIGYQGIFYLQKPYHHLSGNCPENINLATKKTINQFISEANLVHDYRYNYDKSEYVSNQTKTIITCPIHGDFSQRPLSHLQGNGCPNCNESKGEKEISVFLEKHNISFERQKKFHDCRNIFELPFDFYLPKFRIAIEFDGKQHYEPLEFFGGLESYNRLKTNDKIKNDYCEDNYINLIRIRYDQIDDIYRILYDNLKNHIKTKKTS
jgi:hypothetical protein